MKDLPFDPYDFFGYIASGLVAAVTAQVILGWPKVVGADLKMFDIAVVILAVYILGQILAGPSRAIFEDILIHRFLGTPTQNLLRTKAPSFLQLIFPGYYKPLPVAIRVKLSTTIKAMNLGSHEAEGTFLAIRFSPEVLAHDTLIARINSFRDKYGFSRNVSFSLTLAAICLTVVGLRRDNRLMLHEAVIVFIAGVLLFYRYLKFFRQYTYELFNSFASMTEKGNT
jgi:hypothetical protein